jgi:hypothetical protein
MPLSLIPQVFYDLIARVVPGSVVVIMWYLTMLGPKKAINTLITISPKQNIISLWSFALLIMLAYVLGFILNELWDLTFRKIKRKTSQERKSRHLKSSIAQYDRIRKCFGKSELQFGHEDLPSLHTMHDHLRLRSDSEAYRLLKLRAERTLCEALFTGIFLLPIVNVLFWYNGGNLLMLDRIALELVVIVALLTFWGGVNKLGMFYVGGTCTSWLLLNFPIGPDKQAEAEEDKSKEL